MKTLWTKWRMNWKPVNRRNKERSCIYVKAVLEKVMVGMKGRIFRMEENSSKAEDKVNKEDHEINKNGGKAYKINLTKRKYWDDSWSEKKLLMNTSVDLHQPECL